MIEELREFLNGQKGKNIQKTAKMTNRWGLLLLASATLQASVEDYAMYKHKRYSRLAEIKSLKKQIERYEKLMAKKPKKSITQKLLIVKGRLKRLLGQELLFKTAYHYIKHEFYLILKHNHFMINGREIEREYYLKSMRKLINETKTSAIKGLNRQCMENSFVNEMLKNNDEEIKDVVFSRR